MSHDKPSKPATSPPSHQKSDAAQEDEESLNLLRPMVTLYFALCGAAWLVYFTILMLATTGFISPEAAEKMSDGLRGLMGSPLGGLLILVFGVGMIVTGLVAVIVILPLGLLAVLVRPLPGCFQLIVLGAGIGFMIYFFLGKNGESDWPISALSGGDMSFLDGLEQGRRAFKKQFDVAMEQIGAVLGWGIPWIAIGIVILLLGTCAPA